jgi:hypothetical protein
MPYTIPKYPDWPATVEEEYLQFLQFCKLMNTDILKKLYNMKHLSILRRSGDVFAAILMFTAVNSVNAQPDAVFRGYERLFVQPEHYVAAYTKTPPVIDGSIDEKVWENAAWTGEFRDIEGKLSSRPLPYYATRAKMLWDTACLYIAADLKDKHVWAYLDKHDQIVYNDNDFEVFIDPVNSACNYYEIEINALNTIFDFYLAKPYRSGASGMLISWDCKDLRHAVNVRGTLNNPSDEDEGWSVELAIPFKSINRTPEDSSVWRVNFSRVEWDTEIVGGKYVRKTGADGKRLPENNWVWSPQGAIDMHRPERWGYLMFSKVEAGSPLPEFTLPSSELQRQYLWLIFYKQNDYRRTRKRYADTPGALGIDSAVYINGIRNIVSLEATSVQFTATITDSVTGIISINNDGCVRSVKNSK